MPDQNFSPEEFEELKNIHLGDAESAQTQENAKPPMDDLLMVAAGLQSVLDKPSDEVDNSEVQETMGLLLPYLDKALDYFEKYTDTIGINVDIKKDDVLDTRNQFVEIMKEKGTEAPSSIGMGWRKTVYGKAFQDKLFARGAEIWYPGVTKPTPDLELDNPVHIKLIEDPDVDHAPRNISLLSKGIASSSVHVDVNMPDTQAWLEVVKSIEPEEWSTLLQTTLDALKSAK